VCRVRQGAFGRVREFAIRSIAGRKNVGVPGGGAGSAPSGRVMLGQSGAGARRVGGGEENSAYWRANRSGHPDYAQANGEKQRQRDGRRRAAKLAKMDSIGAFSSVPSGTYLLVPQGEEKLAKMDSIMVEITLVSKR
jgi:hypothetical protein